MDTANIEPKLPDMIPFLPSAGDHAMLDIPFVVGIDGRQYRGERLSLVMAEVTGLMDPSLVGASRVIRLIFPFKGFSVVLDVTAEIRSIDRDHGSAVLAFTEPGGAHLPQMRHILNSYIAGDLVAVGDVISIGAALPQTGKRAVASAGKVGLTFRRLIGGVGFALATLALVAVVAGLAYTRIFTTPILAAGRVVQDGMTLTALAAGQIDYVNPDAGKGEVAFSLRTNGGEQLSVAMPCDCSAQLMGQMAGATVQAGAPIMRVAAPDAPTVVMVDVLAPEMLDLAFADHIELRFADGTRVQARFDATSLQGTPGGDVTPVRLVPDTALDPARLGQLAELTIVRRVPFVSN